MGGEDQCGLAVVAQVLEPLVDLLGVEHVALIERVGLEHLQPIDMGEFGGDAAEIVPHALQDFLDLGCGLFRKCRRQIGAADAVLLEPRTEPAHEAAGEVGHAFAAGGADRAQHAHGKKAKRRVRGRLNLLPGAMSSRRGHGWRSRRGVKR